MIRKFRTAANWRTNIFVVLLLLLAGCSQVEYRESSEQKNIGLPDQELFDATIHFSQAGGTRFTVSANRIHRFEANDYLKMGGGVIVDIFDRQNQHRATMTADQADVIEPREELVARGNVIVKSDSGHVLYADTQYYEPQEAKIKSDGFVTMISPTDSLSGVGFSASTDLQEWEIKNTSGETWREIEPSRRSKRRQVTNE